MTLQRLRIVILFGTLAVFLYLVNSGIFSAEQRIASGAPVYLELAPVDPRSLIQGDYMALDYALARAASGPVPEDARRGQLVVTLDENNVAHFERVYTPGETLASGERLINYRLRDGQVLVGVDSFFFQEGQAERYAQAEYAEIRLLADGGVMLIELVGPDFQPLPVPTPVPPS